MNSQTPNSTRMMTTQQAAEQLGIAESEILEKCCTVEEDGVAMVPREELKKINH